MNDVQLHRFQHQHFPFMFYLPCQARGIFARNELRIPAEVFPALLIVSLFPSESDMASARPSINRAEFRFYSFPVSVLLGIPLASPCICTLIGFALATPALISLCPP